MPITTGRIKAAGRVPIAGRVKASGRISSFTRQDVIFRMNLTALFRADNVTVSGGVITDVPDLTGNGNDLYQYTFGQSPTLNPNQGVPSMSFSGSQFLIGVAPLQTTLYPWTMAIVLKPSSLSGRRAVFSPTGGVGGDCLGFNFNANGNREDVVIGAGNVEDGLATTNQEVWILTGADFNGSSLVSLHLYTGIYGTDQTLTAPVISHVTPTGSDCAVGSLASFGNFPYAGDIYELWFADRVLTSTERANYLNYVSYRYGNI